MDEEKSNISNDERREGNISNNNASLKTNMVDEAGKRQEIQKEELSKLVNLLIPKRR